MAPKNRNEYQELLAREFLDCLAQKGLNWKKGWDTVTMSPRNAATGAAYHGINQFHLGLLALTRGYTDPRWATMAQIMDKDGKLHPGQEWRLQKGSRATYVEYWYPWDPEKHEALPWQAYRQLTPQEQERYIMRVRYTPVFHASMIDGIPPIQRVERQPQRLDDLVARLSAGMGVELAFDGGNDAFYHPSEDKVHLPAPEAFHSEYEFNATALHELAHATGHESRLNRPQGARFGTPEYAYEELVAEISSCFMGVGLDTDQTPRHVDNHKAYVQNWIEAISRKPETLITAVRDAQKAAGYMEYHAGPALDRGAELARPVQVQAEKQGPKPEPARARKAERPWSPVTRSGKLHFTDEQYQIARGASALEYARRQGYNLVREGSRYRLAEHDSMIFLPNGQWHWNSRDIHGGAIEFITQYEGKTLPEAILTLNGIDYSSLSRQPEADTTRYAPKPEDLAAAEKPEFILPPKADRMNRLFGYLCGARGLDYDLVRQLVQEHRIYESVYRRPDGSELHNAVFVGFDPQGVPRSASLRGCSQNSSFKMEQPGSDKTWPFIIPGEPTCRNLYIYESAIDALSHATVCKLGEVDWQDGHRVALGGNTSEEAIFNVLKRFPMTVNLCVCTDNDTAGEKMFEKIAQIYREALPISGLWRFISPIGKDWNEYLQVWRKAIERYEELPTTEYADVIHDDQGGRIHYLNKDGSVNKTLGFHFYQNFRASAYTGLDAPFYPCVVETPAQLAELQRLRERRAARQAQDQAQSRAEEALDRVRADGEPDLDKEVSREHRGFLDNAPADPAQRTDMARQLEAAAQEAQQRNQERQAQALAAVREVRE